ncbi:ketose-bisphosphate aldolase [Candidatus Saccharibacteria bacterium RIFCSPHIGHO2_12_FULL_47_16b]|nr:MAG: ketose-bisphosphate aldolase [Candidatus Saccharibacteria bacterium RIFCSPHIGHO2_12_FULL_47_16b]OGL39772.1 MAG: ketose-bisphosphate aldolase [Candidatus Saccharibacteria bacterium RIFCSPLOWO2_02_FULL_46_7]
MANLTKIKKDCRAARDALARARKGHYALGAFNLDNQETLVAVVKAALAKKASVLVEVSQGEVEAIGLNNVRDLVDNYKADYDIEMYINLDHSPSVEAAIAGIEAGFECIHIDISQAKHSATRAEIIAGTKQVVAAAKKTGALVEAEEHYFMGSSNVHTEKIDYDEVKKFETKPAEAADFVAQTGIDTFAAQVGNLHGLYPVPKKLNLDLLKQIRQAINCHISLHGGSGTPAHYFAEAVKIGVTKININSDMRVAYRRTLEKVLAENKTEYAVVKLMGQVIEQVQKVVEDKIDMFNSAGKAKL